MRCAHCTATKVPHIITTLSQRNARHSLEVELHIIKLSAPTGNIFMKQNIPRHMRRKYNFKYKLVIKTTLILKKKSIHGLVI